MDRDATLLESNADAVPLFEWALVWKIGLVGVGLAAGAALLGVVATVMGSPPTLIHTARLFLVFGGVITAGAAVSMRGDLWQAWALGALACALAVGGTPAHWDSFRLLFGAFAGVALTVAVVRLAPPKFWLPLISAALLFHFGGIFLATTTPPPTPWVTEQAFVRVYTPYLQFLYLRNAYHFYSPEPGPASLIVCLLKTETGQDALGRKQYETKWVVLPKRPTHVKDPLGLTYYRRLSITEQLARANPGLLQPSNTAEKNELLPRRQVAARAIPLNPGEEAVMQYRLPEATVTRFVLPSYAAHIILENTDRATAGKTTVKIYRVEHRTMSVEEFANTRDRQGMITNPYDPTTYRPYFLGEFGFVPDPDKPGAVKVELLNPQEPMLYWLVPILNRPGPAVPGDKNRRGFIDYMSIHALDTLNLSDRDVDDPQYRDRVFNWDQLR